MEPVEGVRFGDEGLVNIENDGDSDGNYNDDVLLMFVDEQSKNCCKDSSIR